MRLWALVGWAVGALALVAGLGLALPTDLPPLRPDELASIGSLGPWPPPAARDASNRVSGRAEAAALGEALFHTTRLSTVGGLRCASCHAPWRHFTDGRARALGAEDGARNTPSLLNVRLQHWFGWDGANDSLWSQSIRPMLDAREMRADAAHVARALARRRDPEALVRPGFRPRAAGRRRDGAGRCRQGAGRLPGNAGQRAARRSMSSAMRSCAATALQRSATRSPRSAA